MFFKKKPTPHDPTLYPISRILELIGNADEESLRDTLFKLYHVRRTVLTECGQSATSSFADFKFALRPDQATRVAEKTREVGSVSRKHSQSPLDEMAFMLVAATLHARGGAAWVKPQEENFIDKLIAIAEDIAHR